MNAKEFYVRNLITIIVGLTLCAAVNAAAADSVEMDDVFEMSMEELMNVEIPSGATLTSTDPRLVPAAVTTITEEQILSSGARSLMELLDIYVPNLQWIRNLWEPDNMGLRGIMSDRDDKYLLLVNGRVMNERTHYGVVSEKDLSMMRDIHHIDVIRGPGSALYGPGAVSMVINIVTHNSETFEGTEVTSRAGAVEEFYSTEIKHGRRFYDDDGGLFFYAGIGRYHGASENDAPVILGGDFPTQTGWWDPAWGAGPGPFPADGYRAGSELDGVSIPSDGESHRNLPPMKLYAELNKGNWDMWARYTRGGKQFAWHKGYIARNPVGWTENFWDWGSSRLIKLNNNSYGYQQLTGYIGYEEDLSDQTSVEYAFSYDMMDYERVIANEIVEAYREDEYYGKAMLRHNFSRNHKAALGFEVSHHELGLNSPGWPDAGFINSALANANVSMERWSSNMYSILGEYQWNINDQWTTFLGARIDDHTYSERMFSPRASLVFAPNEKDVYKLMWARSVRANFEEEMRIGALSEKDDGDPEVLDSVELRYERQHSESLDLAASVYMHYNLELITYSGADSAPVPVGVQRDWGFELEAYYHTDTMRFGISHAYGKLYDFNLQPGKDTIVTSKGYGYGDDFARWSNNITKVTAQRKLNDKWTVDGSMRIYWGFPGMKDYDHYLRSTGDTFVKEGWNRSYRGNYYLNLGLQYQPSENTTFRIDGMNLLGLFDKDLNKRNYNGEMYRSHAPSVAFTLVHKFLIYPTWFRHDFSRFSSRGLNFRMALPRWETLFFSWFSS